MYASATTSVRDLTSVHHPFLQSLAWLSLLSRGQKFLFSTALAYKSYWRVIVNIPVSIFMNISGCEQMPEIKKVLCTNKTTVIT